MPHLTAAYLLAAAVAVVAFTAGAAILAWWNGRRHRR